jgi:hypothetical protein
MTKKIFSLPIQTLDDNILLEKRKRTQTYCSIDYLISFITYFDFFSFDAFKIAKYSKFLAQSFGSKAVNSEFLLLPFFEIESELTAILKETNLTPSNIKKSLFPKLSSNNKIFAKIFNKIGLSSFVEFLNIQNINLDNSLNFSHELNLLFEKTAENALLRFKTPVITAEILFVTLMEEKESNAGKLISKYLNNPLDWYLLRYKLLKRIHSQELSIRNKVIKNEQYFAYLLKTQIPEIEFSRLIDNDMSNLGILYFRNRLVNKVLKININELIVFEINKSIKVTNKRIYSS